MIYIEDTNEILLEPKDVRNIYSDKLFWGGKVKNRLVKQAEEHSNMSDDICRDENDRPYYYECTNCGGVELPYGGSLAQSISTCYCGNSNMIKVYK